MRDMEMCVCLDLIYRCCQDYPTEVDPLILQTHCPPPPAVRSTVTK